MVIGPLSHTGGNAIDLTSVVANGYSYAGGTNGGVLTLTENGATVTSIKLSGDYIGSAFNVGTDGKTGTLITDPTPVLAQAMASFGAGGAGAAATAATALSLSSTALIAAHS